MNQGRAFTGVAEYATTRDALIGVGSPTRIVEQLGVSLRLMGETTHPKNPRPVDTRPPSKPDTKPKPTPSKQVPS
jgi:hypothetical protein